MENNKMDTIEGFNVNINYAKRFSDLLEFITNLERMNLAALLTLRGGDEDEKKLLKIEGSIATIHAIGQHLKEQEK